MPPHRRHAESVDRQAGAAEGEGQRRKQGAEGEGEDEGGGFGWGQRGKTGRSWTRQFHTSFHQSLPRGTCDAAHKDTISPIAKPHGWYCLLVSTPWHKPLSRSRARPLSCSPPLSCTHAPSLSLARSLFLARSFSRQPSRTRSLPLSRTRTRTQVGAVFVWVALRSDAEPRLLLSAPCSLGSLR